MYNAIYFRFENALREMIPSVTIPFWDSTLDNELEDPAQSSIWSDELFGNGVGAVKSGPFANWHTRTGPLIRNIGASSPLFREVPGVRSTPSGPPRRDNSTRPTIPTLLLSRQTIEDVLSRHYFEEISAPSARIRYSLEFWHGAVHRWVGGNVGNLQVASDDPIFFLHHSYVDYIWEIFRQQQIANGINPEWDFPSDPHPLHAADAPLGFSALRVIDAHSSVFTRNMYSYQAAPTCRPIYPSCSSRYLQCDLKTYRCIPTQMPGKCPPLAPIQNDFRVNGRSDIKEWGYIPIEISVTRERTLDDFGVFNIIDSKLAGEEGFFALPHITSDSRACYGRQTSGLSGVLFAQVTGFSYDGFYTDFVLIDQRMSRSRTMALVAIRNPTRGRSTSLIRVYDQCGRLCRPSCRVTDAVSERYVPCSGLVRITTGTPEIFSNTYDECVRHLWDARSRIDQAGVFLAFLCGPNDGQMTSNICRFPGADTNYTMARATSNGHKRTSSFVRVNAGITQSNNMVSPNNGFMEIMSHLRNFITDAGSPRPRQPIRSRHTYSEVNDSHKQLVAPFRHQQTVTFEKNSYLNLSILRYIANVNPTRVPDDLRQTSKEG